MLMYERLARELTGVKEFALPYWDWTQDRQLPPAFLDQAWPGKPGKQNPLYESSRTMDPTDSLPDEIVGHDVITKIMGQSDFELFGTSRPQGQDSLDQAWIANPSGTQSTLEFTPHNNVHGWVGGLMGGFRSAFDPIFMMHHCNIDRIWAQWRALPGNLDSSDPLWLGMTFQGHFFNPDGSSYSPKVSDLLIPETLGYSYGIPGPQVATGPNVLSLNSKVNTLFLKSGASAAVGVQTFRAENAQPARATQPLEVPVKVTPALISAVAKRPSLGAGAELLDFRAVREVAASQPRALAFIRDIAASSDSNTQFRVFLNCDYLSQQTPISRNEYVATFGFFGNGEHAGHGGAKPSIVVDLTSTIARVFGAAPVTLDTLRVQILPVPRGKASVEQTGTAIPARVEIAFIPV